jgi:hypothetical protein
MRKKQKCREAVKVLWCLAKKGFSLGSVGGRKEHREALGYLGCLAKKGLLRISNSGLALLSSSKSS